MLINKDSKIFLAGHKGMVGSAIFNHLKKKKYKNIITIDKKKLNLLNQNQTEKFIKKIKPDCVLIAAARVGGILANNNFKANFIYENLMIQTNLIHSSYLAGVKKLIFLGSSCIYPKFARQPINESQLLNGKLEDTNDAYAVAKIAGIKMCEAYNKQYKLNYLCLMPTNLYGPNDNYNLHTSHFFPALIKKIYNHSKKNKKSITLWGTGKPKRELIYVNDLADACIYFMNKKTRHSLINIGTQNEMSISQYANFIKKRLKSNIKIKFDKNRNLDGTPRKILNCSVARLYGWKSKTSLVEGFNETFKHFIKKNR